MTSLLSHVWFEPIPGRIYKVQIRLPLGSGPYPLDVPRLNGVLKKQTMAFGNWKKEQHAML